MADIPLLRDLVIVLAVAVVVVAVLHRMRIPSIAASVLAGVLIGPNALGLVSEPHDVERLAEVGVVLLLFSIGLELSLDRLRRLWKLVIIGGALQVTVTMAAVTAIAVASGLAVPAAIFLGCLLAVSSTAIVLKGLEDRAELDAPHGRLTVGILVFQDLCVVPMILAIPLLAGAAGGLAEVGLATAKAVVILAVAVVGARLLVPRLLALIAATRQRDLFILTVVLICIGIAYLASFTGVSLGLGAFLAGLVVSGSRFRDQAMADILPFRQVLTPLFFVSVGMLLDPRVLWREGIMIAGLLIALLAGKAAIVALVGALMRLGFRVSVMAGVALSQVGEFFFILWHAGANTTLVPPSLSEALPATVILSMLLTPLAVAAAPHIAAGAGRFRFFTRPWRISPAVDAGTTTATWHHHVIIAGYGPAGRRLAAALKEQQVPHLVIDLNPDNVQAATTDGVPAFFGDVSSPEILHHVHAGGAKELILLINDPDGAVRTTRAVRASSPGITIVVRARYASEVSRLQAAGADLVVSDEVEGANTLVTQLLARHSSNRATVLEPAPVAADTTAP